MSFIKGEFELNNIKSNFGGRLIRAKILGKDQRIFSNQTLKESKSFILYNKTPVKKLPVQKDWL